MRRYALFLGCTTPTQVLQYELSSRWICKQVGIELVDIEDFICCGINQNNISLEAGLLLASMNLALAEKRGLDILTLCAACTGHLSEAVEKLKDPKTRDYVNSKLKTVDLKYEGKVRVKHISRVLYEDIGIDRLKEKVKISLSKLRVAPHYGCHYLKPSSAFKGFDDPDNPKTLHHLISVTGAHPVEYETINLCCGGKSFPVSEDIPKFLVKSKLDNLKLKEIDFLVVQCQTCYLMYRDQQKVLNRKFHRKYNMPVLLYPQLLGAAMGGDLKDDLGIHLNGISVADFAKKSGVDLK
ncbi:MAG: CoB--CoM heterodisulfide reductase iron-sulfur subunit B family protein [Candidatus Aminicenantes bacterium]